MYILALEKLEGRLKYLSTNSTVLMVTKWLINLTDTDIPNDVGCFLRLGENACINPRNKGAIVEETLA